MIICEFGFEDPDPNNKKYSMREVDYYGWVPYQARQKYGIKNHRLSLRKNLETGKFEVYRYFYDEKREEVAFEGSFEEALEFANKERNKYWGVQEPDKPCRHKHPQLDWLFCPKMRGE